MGGAIVSMCSGSGLTIHESTFEGATAGTLLGCASVHEERRLQRFTRGGGGGGGGAGSGDGDSSAAADLPYPFIFSNHSSIPSLFYFGFFASHPAHRAQSGLIRRDREIRIFGYCSFSCMRALFDSVITGHGLNSLCAGRR